MPPVVRFADVSVDFVFCVVLLGVTTTTTDAVADEGTNGSVARDRAVVAAPVDVQSTSRQQSTGRQTNPPTNDHDVPDAMRDIQTESANAKSPVYGHWGTDRTKYSSWTNHSNRLVPAYTFGITLSALRDRGSVYADRERLNKLAGRADDYSVNPHAAYFDQTDLYTLQQSAIDAGYTNIILIVFDGMDWRTSRAASLYKTGRIAYESGRGTGLGFQDDRRTVTDFALFATGSGASGAETDVNAQRVINIKDTSHRGFDARLAGQTPWQEHEDCEYLLGTDRNRPHCVTDSAASATSLCSGIKTYNGAINVTLEGEHVTPIARKLQREQDFMVGLVTSVPVSHATPAAGYANNVSRKDYQDISRDLLGLPSSSHRTEPLRGVDVLIGCGWGETEKTDELQGHNFMEGNPYLHESDIDAVNIDNGGRYRVVQRQPGKSGRQALIRAAQRSADNSERLLGFFGVGGGHLPYATADGKFNPTVDTRDAEIYSSADLAENPTLADMTEAALLVLEQSVDGFWLMIEAGDVDWANHANNLDNSIGAVLSGDAAFVKVMDWVDENNAWDHTAVIVAADHGHYLVIDRPETIAAAGRGQHPTAETKPSSK